MPDLDLNSMPLAELKQIHKELAKAIAGYEDRKKAEARTALEAQAKEFGFSLADLVGATGRKRAASQPKYRHPENPEVTWTGRGRKPKWVSAHIAAGKPIEALEI